MTRKQIIGFFGGTFDPIHSGHINLALEMQEKCRLDQVVFCPTAQSPFKEDSPPIAANMHRLQMLKAALSDIPDFSIYEEEIQKNIPSYTIDSLKKIIQKNPNHSYHLVLGEDVVGHFHRWKEAEELLHLAPPLIGARPGFENQNFTDLPASISAAIKKGMRPISIMEISSTTIRKRLSWSLYCGHLLPGKVLDYIRQNRLYL